MSGLCGSLRSCVLLCICCFARSLVQFVRSLDVIVSVNAEFFSEEELTGTRDTHVVLGGGWVRLGSRGWSRVEGRYIQQYTSCHHQNDH